MKTIESVTCIKFEERSKNQHQELFYRPNRRPYGDHSATKWLSLSFYFEFEKNSVKDYIEFWHGRGCYSSAGRIGQRQYITLSPKCAEEHTLIHEVFYESFTKSLYSPSYDLINIL